MNKTFLVGLAALIIGILASGSVAAYAVNGNHVGIMKAYAIHMDMSGSTGQIGSMSMDGMTASLRGKTGDAFDNAFLAEMIVHHQGAIDMANLALTNAQHQEVKDLAKNILTAQTSEINQMKAWQIDWGYAPTANNDSSMPGMGM